MSERDVKPRRLLLVFDETMRGSVLPSLEGWEAVPFPLTSDAEVMDAGLSALNKAGAKVNYVPDVARQIQNEATSLASSLVSWVRGVFCAPIEDGYVADAFEYRAGATPMNARWLSLLEEKNPLKTPFFFQMACLTAVDELLAKGEFACCLVFVGNEGFRKGLRGIATTRGCLPFPEEAPRRASRSRTFFRWVSAVSGALKEILAVAYCGFWAKRVFRVAPAPSERAADVLCVSYFPNYEQEAAQRGVFRNKYVAPLQDLVASEKKRIAWLLLYAGAIREYSRHMRQVMAFRAQGEEMVDLYSFVSIPLLLQALQLWMRQSVRAARLLKVARRAWRASPLPAGAESFPEQLWIEDFAGAVGMQGILFTLLFDKALQGRKERQCVYCCEMQAWERALCAASREHAPDMRLVAFQHSSLSKNYYFYAAVDFSSDSPLPHAFACGGPELERRFRAWGYPDPVAVESLRYLPLDGILHQEKPRQRVSERRMLLIAGSIDREETVRLLRMVRDALPFGPNVDIVFKGHPWLAPEGLFAAAGCSTEAIRPVSGEIGSFLEQAFAVFVPTSTVSIEALAYGCEVIVPLVADALLMNPLADYEERCHLVSSAEELRKTIEGLLDGSIPSRAGDGTEFIRNYWHLDPELPRWRALLFGEASADQPPKKE